jgi:hypothetical protein
LDWGVPDRQEAQRKLGFLPIGNILMQCRFRLSRAIRDGKIVGNDYEFVIFTFCKYFFASSTFLGNKTLSLSFDATKDKSSGSGGFTDSFDFVTLVFIV